MEVTGVSTAAAASEVASTKLAENFDTFLNLLVAQLQNQDPLEPTETEQFVQQLVQFSQVEQQIDTNSSLEKLLDFQTTGQAAAAISYLGSTVQAVGNVLPLQNSKAEIGYAVSEDAEKVQIRIKDLDGKTVRTEAGNTEIGKHSFAWDGLDGGGNQLSDGSYIIEVTMTDSDKAVSELPTSVFGKVTGVESTDDGALVSLSGVNVPLTAILSVRESDPAPAT